MKKDISWKEVERHITNKFNLLTNTPKVHKVGNKYYKMVKEGDKWSRVEVK